MRKYKKLKEKVNKQFENRISKLEEVSKNMKEFIEINNKMLDNFEKLDKIVEDIDKEFAEKTGILNKKDQVFLWTAVALQVSRIYIISEITKIENAGEGKLEESLKNFQKEIFKNFENKNRFFLVLYNIDLYICIVKTIISQHNYRTVLTVKRKAMPEAVRRQIQTRLEKSKGYAMLI